MSCNIYVNQKKIINCSVGAFQTMYDILNENAESNYFYNSDELKNLFNEMFIATESRCSYGFDFSEYIKDTGTVNLLITIIDNTIPELKKELIERVITRILELKTELMIYGDKLKMKINSET